MDVNPVNVDENSEYELNRFDLGNILPLHVSLHHEPLDEITFCEEL